MSQRHLLWMVLAVRKAEYEASWWTCSGGRSFEAAGFKLLVGGPTQLPPGHPLAFDIFGRATPRVDGWHIN